MYVASAFEIVVVWGLELLRKLRQMNNISPHVVAVLYVGIGNRKATVHEILHSLYCLE